MNLIIVRHGETEENRKGIIQGQTRGTLSAEGKRQVQKLAEELKDIHIDHIYSSDLERAVDTAKPISKFHLNSPLHFTNQLRELSSGKLSVLPLWFPPKLANRALWLAIKLNIKTPGGESWKGLKRRETLFLNYMYKKYPNDTILLVTHGITMRAIRSIIENVDKEVVYKNQDVPNCVIWKLKMNNSI